MTDTAATLAVLTAPHEDGHLCTSPNPEGLSNWWNPGAGRRHVCPTLAGLRELAAELERLRGLPSVDEVVHRHAHHTPTALVVGGAAAGYAAHELDALDGDSRVGMIAMGQYALEALCEVLLAPVLP